MAARKLGASWWCDFRFDGARYRKRAPLNTKGGAQTYEVLLRGELAKRGSLEHLKPAPTPVPFVEFAERWMRDYVAVNNKPSEARRKRQVLDGHLLPVFGRRALRDISAADIERFKQTRRAELRLTAKTVNNHLTVLRRCLALAVEWGELESVPIVRRLREIEPGFRVLAASDEARLLAEARPPWREMVLVALRTGLRFSELIALTADDVALDGPRPLLHVRRACVRGITGSPKNGRTRHVALTRDATAAFRAVCSERPQAQPLFSQASEYKLAWRWITRTCETAGIPHVTWHDLRHTFASRLVAAGAPLKAVQELLGHASIIMTMRYAHLGPEVLENAIALLEPPRGEDGQPAVQVAPPGARMLASARQHNEETGLWPVSTMVQPAGVEASSRRLHEPTAALTIAQLSQARGTASIPGSSPPIKI